MRYLVRFFNYGDSGNAKNCRGTLELVSIFDGAQIGSDFYYEGYQHVIRNIVLRSAEWTEIFVESARDQVDEWILIVCRHDQERRGRESSLRRRYRPGLRR